MDWKLLASSPDGTEVWYFDDPLDAALDVESAVDDAPGLDLFERCLDYVEKLQEPATFRGVTETVGATASVLGIAQASKSAVVALRCWRGPNLTQDQIRRRLVEHLTERGISQDQVTVSSIDSAKKIWVVDYEIAAPDGVERRRARIAKNGKLMQFAHR